MDSPQLGVARVSPSVYGKLEVVDGKQEGLAWSRGLTLAIGARSRE